MRFLLLLYGDEAAELALTADERRAIVERHQAFSRDLGAAGKLLGGDALTSAADAAVVRRGGSVSDGHSPKRKSSLAATTSSIAAIATRPSRSRGRSRRVPDPRSRCDRSQACSGGPARLLLDPEPEAGRATMRR